VTDEKSGAAPPSALDTLSPARNFTIHLEDRVRAMGGPPAYMRRKRDIEDLEARLVASLKAHDAKRQAALAARAMDELARLGDAPRGFVRSLADLNDLIDRHNRYYPIEANLPIDPKTGRLLDGGHPFAPHPPLTLADLRARTG
jgi:hypothetical protein